MTTAAQDLRALVRELENVCRRSPVNSMAMPAVNALCEYLSLRARLMEIENPIKNPTHCPNKSSEDPPNPER